MFFYETFQWLLADGDSRDMISQHCVVWLQAESEYRHNLLLKRAAHRFGTSESSGEQLAAEARDGGVVAEAPRILPAGQLTC